MLDASVGGGKTAVNRAGSRVRRPPRTLGVVLVRIQAQVQAAGHRGRRRLVVVLVQTRQRFRSSLARRDDGGGVGGRGVDGASDVLRDGMIRPGRGTAQGRGVLRDERFEGERRGKLHRTRRLDHSHRERRRGWGGLRSRRGVSVSRVFVTPAAIASRRLCSPGRRLVPEPLEVHHEHPGQPHDPPNERRGRAVAPVSLARTLQHLGGEKPVEQRRELDVGGLVVEGAFRKLDGEVPEGLVPHARVPARLARQRRGDRRGEVPARGAQGPVQRHHALRFGRVQPTGRVRRRHLLLQRIQALAQKLVRVVLPVTRVVRVPALHRGLHLRRGENRGGTSRRGEGRGRGRRLRRRRRRSHLGALVRRPPRRHQPAHGAVHGPVVEPPVRQRLRLRRARELLQPAEHLQRGVEVAGISQIPQTRGARHRTSGDRRGAFGVHPGDRGRGFGLGRGEGVGEGVGRPLRRGGRVCDVVGVPERIGGPRPGLGPRQPALGGRVGRRRRGPVGAGGLP
mmetsp:Transcript_10735/g.44633  ORF Transcript_10735/g.44633 Transcript_10735/m.44633 type:complete len:509 (+) Transcript_10735:508-2034(+)